MMEGACSLSVLGSAAGLLLSIGKGITTSKVVPSPFVLSTAMVPPIFSTRFFVMDMPSPVPPYSERADMPSCVKGSNTCCRKSGDMPMPVSRHLNCICDVVPSLESSRQVMYILPLGLLYLMALLRMLVMMRLRCRGLPTSL